MYTSFQVKPIILFKFEKLRRKQQLSKESVSMNNVPSSYPSFYFLESISQKLGSEETSSLWKMKRLAAKSGKRWSPNPTTSKQSWELPCKSLCSEAISQSRCNPEQCSVENTPLIFNRDFYDYHIFRK